MAGSESGMMPCDLCPRTTRLVCGNGPIPSTIMAIGEAPGKDEDRTGIPFVGQSGREFNETYLKLAGLQREEIYVTNTRKCRPENNRKPMPREASVCAAHHLPSEIEQVQPEVIFLLGATACDLVPDIQLDVEHGIPRWCGDLFGWSGWVVPMYHPASGLHNTSMMIPILEDWGKMPYFLSRGQYRIRVDETEEYLEQPRGADYRLARSRNDVNDYFNCHYSRFHAIDTESHNGIPWSIQISSEPGTALMIRMDDEESLEWLAGALNQFLYLHGDTIVFHNAPADLPVVESLIKKLLRSEYEPFEYRDTMQEAYNLGNLPQGLKALGYRLFGVKMQSWEDLVTPYSQLEVLMWMVEAAGYESSHPDIQYEELKTKVREVVKPNATEKALMRIMKHTSNGDDYDPWERLDQLDLRRAIEKCGPIPRKGIAHVPLQEAVRYGCRDADITLRLALKLEQLRKGFENEWPVHPEDWDRPTTAPTMAHP